MKNLHKMQQIRNQIKALKKEESKLKLEIIKEFGEGIAIEDDTQTTIKYIEDYDKVDYKALVAKLNPSKYMIKKFTSSVKGYFKILTIKTIKAV